MTKPGRTRIHIGTSGYSFKDWNGPFYPKGLAAGEMLKFYAEHFNTVEVNFTYYRLPTAKTCDGMASNTPEDFQFFVKAYKAFTHDRELGEKDIFLEGIRPMTDAGKMAGLLFQFPQSFKNTEDNRGYLSRVADAFTDITSAVEFRDRSWASEPVYTFLGEQGLSVVSVDEPQISTLFPPEPIVSSELGYVRFHSRDGGKWYKGIQKRYDYHYSSTELEEWIPKIKTIAERARNIFVYFNNCHGGQAAKNAEEMKRIIRESGLDGHED